MPHVYHDGIVFIAMLLFHVEESAGFGGPALQIVVQAGLKLKHAEMTFRGIKPGKKLSDKLTGGKC